MGHHAAKPRTRCADRRGLSPLKTLALGTGMLLVTGVVGWVALQPLSGETTTFVAEHPWIGADGGDLSHAPQMQLAPRTPDHAQRLYASTAHPRPATDSLTDATITAARPALASLDAAHGTIAAAATATDMDTDTDHAEAEVMADDDARELHALQRARVADMDADEDARARLDTAREILAAHGTAEADDQLLNRSLMVLAELEPGSVASMLHDLAAVAGEVATSDDVLAQALGSLSRREDVLEPQDLAALFDHGPRPVQRVAARALAERGDDSLSQLLRERCVVELDHMDGRVRAEAVRDLAAQQDPAVEERIAPLLEDDDPGVRLQSLRALERSQDPAVQQRVRSLVDDPAPDVRRVARRAVARLDRQDVARSDPGW